MNQAIKILEEMIADANKSMYPEKGQLDMKEFNVFSCGKASLEIARDRILALPSDTQGYTKKEVLDFAYWYHNGLLNRYRQEVEVEFDDFIKYHRQGLIPNKIIGN